jgi:2,4-dienoyl-CoA reductase-like NADH-dependent reductase (Old Yellow Enzyme family)
MCRAAARRRCRRYRPYRAISSNSPTIAVGLITEAEQAEAIIASGQADFVALARGMLYDPRWPWHAAAKLGAQVDAAPQYLRCQPRELKTLFR